MVAVTYGVARAAAGKLSTPRAAKSADSPKGFFARLHAALIDARMRQAHRELALHRHLWTHDTEPVDQHELPFGR